MNEQVAPDLNHYPLVRQAQGGPTPDGTALLVEAATAEGKPVRFAISLTDVQHFVAFLLISTGAVGAMQEDAASSDNVGQSPPVPVTSIAVGEPDGNEGYLGIAVGRAELVFSLPVSAFDELGRALLTISARPDGRYRA